MEECDVPCLSRRYPDEVWKESPAVVGGEERKSGSELSSSNNYLMSDRSTRAAQLPLSQLHGLSPMLNGTQPSMHTCYPITGPIWSIGILSPSSRDKE